MLADRRHFYPLSISDFTTRYLLGFEAPHDQALIEQH
jgi:hypothetical protein